MKYLIVAIAFLLVACDNYQTVQKPEPDDFTTDTVADADDLVADALDEPEGGADEDIVSADTEAPDTLLDEPDEIVPDDVPCVDGLSRCLDEQTMQECHLGTWGSYDCTEFCLNSGYTQSLGCRYMGGMGKDWCFCQ